MSWKTIQVDEFMYSFPQFAQQMCNITLKTIQVIAFTFYNIHYKKRGRGELFYKKNYIKYFIKYLNI
jgi:hypothetical protein